MSQPQPGFNVAGRQADALSKLEEHFKFTLDVETRKKLAKEGDVSKQHELIALNSGLAVHAKACAASLSDKEYKAIMAKIFPVTGKIHGIKQDSPDARPEWEEQTITDQKPTAAQLVQQTCWLIEKECTEQGGPDKHPKSVADKMAIFHKYMGCLARASYELQINQDLAADQKQKNQAALGSLTAEPLQPLETTPVFLDRIDQAERAGLIAPFREAAYEMLFRDSVVTKQVSALLLDCNSLTLNDEMRQNLENNQITQLTDSEKALLAALNKKTDQDKENTNKLAFDRAFNLAIINAIERERVFKRKTYNSESFFEYLGRKIHAKLIGMEIPPGKGIFVTKDTLNPANLYRGKYIWALYGQMDDNGKWVETNEPIFYYRTDSWFKVITPKTFNRGSISEARLIFNCIEEFVRFCNPHDANDITNPSDIGGNVPVNGLMYMLQCMNMALHPRPEDVGLPVYVKDAQGNVYDLASDANKELLKKFQEAGNRQALNEMKPMGKLDDKGKLHAFKDDELDAVQATFYQTVYGPAHQAYLQSTRTAHSVNPFERMGQKLNKKFSGSGEPEKKAWCQMYQHVSSDTTNTAMIHFDVCAMYLLNGHGQLWGKAASKKAAATMQDLTASANTDDDLGFGVNPVSQNGPANTF
jgi:hypothetical protein